MSNVAGQRFVNAAEAKLPAQKVVEKHAVRPGAIGPGLPCVRSDELIGKDREIMIEHDGAYYRLRITRANKLILTK